MKGTFGPSVMFELGPKAEQAQLREFAVKSGVLASLSEDRFANLGLISPQPLQRGRFVIARSYKTPHYQADGYDRLADIVTAHEVAGIGDHNLSLPGLVAVLQAIYERAGDVSRRLNFDNTIIAFCPGVGGMVVLRLTPWIGRYYWTPCRLEKGMQEYIERPAIIFF